MAEGGEVTRHPSPRVLNNLKLPVFDWKAHNPQSKWEIFKAQITFVLEGMEIPRRKWYLYITQQCDKEGSCRHSVLSEGKAARNTASKDCQRVQQSQVTLSHHMETGKLLREREGFAKYQVSDFQVAL